MRERKSEEKEGALRFTQVLQEEVCMSIGCATIQTTKIPRNFPWS